MLTRSGYVLLSIKNSGRVSPVSSSSQDRITFNSFQCGGRPCIRGMRIRVQDILEMLASGVTEKQILADFPDLETEDIRACLKYAAAQASHAVLKVA
ncbi:MAG: hypothetical protein C5B47_03145 [Verrucomicrobia bacterium]|nr:MAG: hypothetical protein C5B47_03145 [Verrucomicrobiota bacterium]